MDFPRIKRLPPYVFDISGDRKLAARRVGVGWEMPNPQASMFVWGHIPEAYRVMGSIEFSKFLREEAKVAVSPGIGFGEYGDEYVRVALIENEHRTRQAVRGIRKAFGGVSASDGGA
jgi:alanine-synthesizing transaminase